MNRWAFGGLLVGSALACAAAAVYLPTAAIGGAVLLGLLLLAVPGAGVAFGWSGSVLVTSEIPEGSGLALSAAFLTALLILAGRVDASRATAALRQRWPELVLGVIAFVISQSEPIFPSAEGRWLQLLYGIYLACVVTLVVSNYHRRSQYLLALSLLGATLGASELLRVLAGGSQHSEVVSFGLNPIDLARVCGLGTVAAVLLVLDGHWARRLWLLPIAAFGMAGTVASGSRGPFLAVVLATLYGLAMRSRSRLAGRLIAAGAVAAVAFYFISQTSDRVVAAGLRGDSVRLDAWQVALKTALDHPFTGAGYGYYWRSNGVPLVVPFPHNLFLETAAELGLVAVTLVAVGAIRAWRVADPSERTVLIFSATCVCVSGNLGQSHLWWAAVGLAGAVRLGQSHRGSKGEEVGTGSEAAASTSTHRKA